MANSTTSHAFGCRNAIASRLGQDFSSGSYFTHLAVLASRFVAGRGLHKERIAYCLVVTTSARGCSEINVGEEVVPLSYCRVPSRV